MPAIDVWAQHPTKRLLAQPIFDSLKRWTRQDYTEIPLEATVHAMTSAPVEKALLCAWHGPQGDLISNEEVLAAVSEHPDLFAGIAAVDIRDPVRAVGDASRVRAIVRLQGPAHRAVAVGAAPDHALFYPLFAACVELDVPVCLQVGHTGPLRSSEPGRPMHIERVALDFPDLKIVCGHIGYPWQTEMIAVATKFPNVYIDTSAYKPRRYPAELVAYMKAHGKRKVLFGSNYPMLLPADCLKEVESLGLEPETLELFLRGNATRVFQL